MPSNDRLTVEFWQSVVSVAKSKNLKSWDDIALLLATADAGKEPWYAKVCMWTCGVFCCVPCIYDDAKHRDIKINNANIQRTWRLIGLHKVNDFLALIEKLLAIIERKPNVLGQLNDAVVMEGCLMKTDAPFAGVELEDPEDVCIVKVCTYVVNYHKCTLYPYHPLEMKREIHQAIEEYIG